MNSIIIYFSLLGHNRRIAEEIAEKENYNLLEFASGSIFRGFQYLMGKKRLAKKAKKINVDVANYSEIIICGPIWGGKPAPAINALLNNLDMRGKNIRCYFTYTQDYGNSEDMAKNLIQNNSGIVKEIGFKKISKE